MMSDTRTAVQISRCSKRGEGTVRHETVRLVSRDRLSDIHLEVSICGLASQSRVSYLSSKIETLAAPSNGTGPRRGSTTDLYWR
jgi:hypothetical protein